VKLDAHGCLSSIVAMVVYSCLLYRLLSYIFMT